MGCATRPVDLGVRLAWPRWRRPGCPLHCLHQDGAWSAARRRDGTPRGPCSATQRIGDSWGWIEYAMASEVWPALDRTRSVGANCTMYIYIYIKGDEGLPVKCRRRTR